VILLCWILLFTVLFQACDEKPSPQDAESNVPKETLKRRFVDVNLPPDERLAAGTRLLEVEGGGVFLASRYKMGDQRLLGRLLQSAVQKDGVQASRLAVRLMEVALGEEKLEFVAVLLRQGDDAVGPLTRLVAESGDWQSVVTALEALGKLRAAVSAEVIVARLTDSNTWVRMAAAHALGEVGHSDAAQLLTAALNDTSDTVIAAVLVGLGRTGDERALSPCIAYLAHPNPRVRGSAVSALGRLGGREAEIRLNGMLEDPDEGVRFKVDRALKAIQR